MKNSKILGLGLIGAGEFGNFASKVIDSLKTIKLIAVADVNEKSAKNIAMLYRAQIYRDYRKMLQNPGIDIVMINTPNDYHEKMVIEALEAGKHIFCEKPLAITEKGLKKIFDKVKKTKSLVAVDFVLRQNKFYKLIKHKSKSFGQLRSVIVNNQATESTIKEAWYWNTKRSGGWFLTADIHFYDLFQFLGGFEKNEKIQSTEYVNKNSQKTIAIETFVATNTSNLYVYHNFEANYKNADCLVVLDYDHAHVEILGWVPTKITITKSDKTKSYELKTPREAEYHAMVGRGMESLARAIKKKLTQKEFLNPADIIYSHNIGIKATKSARIMEIL